MTSPSLEQRLREKIPTAIPRPGFETRIQAMAREPFAPDKKGFLRRIAIPALAVLILFIILAPGDKPAGQVVDKRPSSVEPAEEAVAEIEKEAPVQREIQGLKNDAQRTMSLFQKALPSLPVKKKDKEEK